MLHRKISDTQRSRSIEQRMLAVHAALFLALLLVVARLIELQILRGEEFFASAQAQHSLGVRLPARRGEILSRSSKTGETSILATNTTLDLVYVDPLITDDPTVVAETLSDLLLTEEIHATCSAGDLQCPREFMGFYESAFDPLVRYRGIGSGVLLEPLDFTRVDEAPDLTEIRRLFARSIEQRIFEKRVRFVPLVYGATKIQMDAVRDLSIGGITVSTDAHLIYADPEEIDQLRIPEIARALGGHLEMDDGVLRKMLRSRPLRYVSIMRRLPPEMSAILKETLKNSQLKTAQLRKEAATVEAAEKITDPLRSIALLPENWRYYPDGTLGSHVVGFLNATQEAQYGIERTFDPVLRGQEGLITTVSDPTGGQILTADQTIIDPKDGDTVVLTIDRTIQKEVETIMEKAVKDFQADSGQALVMEPRTGRILAMVNAPLFDANDFGIVYEKEPIAVDEGRRKGIVVEIYHPITNAFVLKAYLDDVFTEAGRAALSEEKRAQLAEIEALYDLPDIARYYLYLGENNRWEIFPTERRDIWLKFKNSIGVGAYLNRTIQAVYEPGSVAKPITMAIAIDQGEVTPYDTYDDLKPVKVDEFTIQNALRINYGKVTMTNCLEFSINTCMTSVSLKLGKKLFHRSLERFGFGRITGIELEDELPGEILPWKNWSSALLATASYGQGVSTTPLQIVTAFAALANGGKLMKPTIIDSIIRSDGTEERAAPQVVDQVITPEASQTITAMLVSAVTNGYAKSAKVTGHRIAGKTGTSQIAGPGGKYETGTGSVVTSFGGFAPVDDPKFVVLVKFDRPKAHGLELGVQSAAPVFKEIATFLFRYYGIPPDEE